MTVGLLKTPAYSSVFFLPLHTNRTRWLLIDIKWQQASSKLGQNLVKKKQEKERKMLSNNELISTKTGDHLVRAGTVRNVKSARQSKQSFVNNNICQYYFYQLYFFIYLFILKEIISHLTRTLYKYETSSLPCLNVSSFSLSLSLSHTHTHMPYKISV